MPDSSTTDRICQAAIRTVSRDGLLAMTLDNVAKEAGVSKGGVMYHFPSKEQLVTGMLTYFGDQAERMLLERLARDPEPRRRWARAMIDCLFPQDSEVNSADEDFLSAKVIQQFMLTVVAAAVNNPGMFEPLRKVGERLRERLLCDPEDGLDQLLIWLAVDGLFLWQFVGLIDPADPLFQQIGAALRRQTEPAVKDSPKQNQTKVGSGTRSSTRGRRRES